MTSLRRTATLASILVPLALTGGCVSPYHWRGEEGAAHELVNKATLSLLTLGEHPGDRPLQEALHGACAVFIFPIVTSASFVAGGAEGRGVLLMRDGPGDAWNGPAFYAMTEASVGIQAGFARRDTVVVLHRCDALDDQVRANAAVGVAATIAIGDEGGATSAMSKDMKAFSRVSGAQVGVALEGVVLRPRQALADAFYGEHLEAADIFRPRSVDDASARELRQTVLQATR